MMVMMTSNTGTPAVVGRNRLIKAKNNPLHLCTDNSWVAQFRGDKVKVKMQDILTMMPLDY